LRAKASTYYEWEEGTPLVLTIIPGEISLDVDMDLGEPFVFINWQDEGKLRVSTSCMKL
jgi:hypothetical protein